MIRMKGLSVLLLATAFAFVHGSSQDLTMTSQGKLRKYRLHVPSSYNGKKAVPLVLVLHGRGGQGAGFEQTSQMSPVSDQKGFIVVYPSAIGTPPAWKTDWDWSNAGTNDVQFIKELIDKIEGKYKIDKKRVFCAGFSSGGIMCHQLGASLSHRFAAIAVVEGTIGAKKDGVTNQVPSPSEPVSAIMFHGKDDHTVSYEEGPVPQYPDWTFLSIHESVDFWVQHDGCSTPPTKITSDGGNVVRSRYPNGQHGTDVVLYSIGDGTHRWQNPNTGFETRNAIWAFFAKHPKQ